MYHDMIMKERSVDMSTLMKGALGFNGRTSTTKRYVCYGHGLIPITCKLQTKQHMFVKLWYFQKKVKTDTEEA